MELLKLSRQSNLYKSKSQKSHIQSFYSQFCCASITSTWKPDHINLQEQKQREMTWERPLRNNNLKHYLFSRRTNLHIPDAKIWFGYASVKVHVLFSSTSVENIQHLRAVANPRSLNGFTPKCIHSISNKMSLLWPQTYHDQTDLMTYKKDGRNINKKCHTYLSEVTSSPLSSN